MKSRLAVPALLLAFVVTASAARASTLVHTWGSGVSQLGLGDGTITAVSPVSPVGLPAEVVAVSAGRDAVYAVGGDGALWSWGNNTYSVLGTGTTTHISTPTVVSALASGVTQVSGGSVNAYALKDGTLYAWGDNGRGQLGINSTTNNHAPVAVNALTNVSSFSAGEEFALAVQNGALYSWGRGLQGRTGQGSTANWLEPTAVASLASGVTAVAAGQNFGFAVQNGALHAWGSNSNGQLGLGSGTSQSLVPTAVSTLSSGVTAVSAGHSHTLAIKDGNLWVWGSNAYGQLGLGDLTDRLTPTLLAPPTGYRYTSIDAGSIFAIATLAPVAVPEPATLALAGLGMAACLAVRRRRA